MPVLSRSIVSHWIMKNGVIFLHSDWLKIPAQIIKHINSGTDEKSLHFITNTHDYQMMDSFEVLSLPYVPLIKVFLKIGLSGLVNIAAVGNDLMLYWMRHLFELDSGLKRFRYLTTSPAGKMAFSKYLIS